MSTSVDIQVLEMVLDEWKKYKRNMMWANFTAAAVGTCGIGWAFISSSVWTAVLTILVLVVYSVFAAVAYFAFDSRILGAETEIDLRAKLLRKREALYRSMTVGDEPESYWDYPSPPIQMWNPKN